MATNLGNNLLNPHWSCGYAYLPNTAWAMLLAILLSAGCGFSGGVRAVPSGVPPGYSAEKVEVKFRADINRSLVEAVLPPGLQNSVDRMAPLFGVPKNRLRELRDNGEQRSGKMPPDLNAWHTMSLKPGTDAVGFVEALRRLDSVESVQFAPFPAPPPAVTPDFTTNQGYLGAATDGIDARFAWTIPGGNGAGIRIFDVEYSWHQTHEDLSKANSLALLLNPGDTASDPFSDDNHGTAVLGEIVADDDTKGVTGISWGSNLGLAPANTTTLNYNPANAILRSVMAGSPGDVILLEQQVPVCGLTDFGPIEWVRSVFDAIQTAVAAGFVVVEAAGNGSVNLDQAACGTTFDRNVHDSGAIIVGAGGQPSGLDRQRLSFSSYGSRVDVQGWGEGVMTTGYGFFYLNPDDPTNPNFWYTNRFNGTSSASPIVAGAVADLQGIALNRFGVPLTASKLRQLLVDTGSSQLGNTAEHIGPRPNLREGIRQSNASLTVEKILVHPDQNHLRLFNLQIDRVTVRANVNAGSTGRQVETLGNHTVGETGGTGTGLGGFFTVIGGDCAEDGNVSLAPGDNKTCTITNYDNSGGCRRGSICTEPGDGTEGCLQCSRPGGGGGGGGGP